MNPGDVYFVKVEEGILNLAKAENPFDALAQHANEEYEAGKTMSLREFARAEGMNLEER